MIERLLGQNLVQNYPTRDRYVRGVATSIKSIDTRLSSYQSRTGLGGEVMGYADDAANGIMRNWSTNRLQNFPITQRVLQVAIPAAQMSSGQIQGLKDAIAYGAGLANPVTVQIVVIP